GVVEEREAEPAHVDRSLRRPEAERPHAVAQALQLRLHRGEGPVQQAGLGRQQLLVEEALDAPQELVGRGRRLEIDHRGNPAATRRYFASSSPAMTRKSCT